MQFFFSNIVMLPLFKQAPVMCRRGPPEEQQRRKQTSRCAAQQRRGYFCTVPFFFCAFTQSGGKKSLQHIKRGIKRTLLSYTEAEIRSRRVGVETGVPFIFRFSFPMRPLQQFPCNIIRSGGGKLSVWIFRKIDQGSRRHSHVTPSRENACLLLGMAVCVNESVNQTTFSKSWPTKLHVRDLSHNLQFM